jgi:outer membrane protein
MLAPIALAQPLPTLWQAALAADPAVSASHSQAMATQERLLQARAALGPTASLSASASATRYRDAADLDTRSFSTRQANLQLTQPLLRPGLLRAREQAQALDAQAQAQWRQARMEASQRFVDALAEFLKARDAVALLQVQQIAAREQLALARRKLAVGTVPVTDEREAQARVDGVLAQLGAAQSEWRLRRQVLAELTGVAIAGLDDRTLPGTGLPSVADDDAAWLDALLARNPQVEQARHALAAATAEIGKAQAGHAPGIDLSYTYALNADTGTALTPIPRRGTSRQLGINITVPLYSGGATDSRVREALALQDKARFELDAARRSVTLAARQLVSAGRSARTQAQGLEAAVLFAQTALRSQRRGYEVGVRVMAEVLDAQGRLHEVRRDLSRARYDAWAASLKLEALAQRLGDEDFQRLDQALVAVAAPVPLQGPIREAQP